MLETRVQPTYSLDIYIIFISLFTADVFVTYVRDKGSTNLFLVTNTSAVKREINII
jgi:hypothetical protein